MTQSQRSSRRPSSASRAAPLPGQASLRLAGCIPQRSISLGTPAPRQRRRKGLTLLSASPHRPAGLRLLRRGEPTRSGAAGDSPLHDDEQTLPPLVEVLVDVHDADDVGALRCPPVQLHFPAGLRAVLQHLREKRDPVSPEAPGRARPRHPASTAPTRRGCRGKGQARVLSASRRAPARFVQCLHPHLAGRARSRSRS